MSHATEKIRHLKAPRYTTIKGTSREAAKEFKRLKKSHPTSSQDFYFAMGWHTGGIERIEKERKERWGRK